MKTFFSQILIYINMFVIIVLFLYLFTQLLVEPLWETTWCGGSFCRTMEYHIIYSKQEFSNYPVKEKDLLEVYEQKDNMFNMSYYFLRTHKKIFSKDKNKYYDDDRYIFSSGYFSKENATRDLELIKNNNPVVVSKKNVGLIQTLCIGIYIILMCFGIIITMIIRIAKEYNSKTGSGENIEVGDM